MKKRKGQIWRIWKYIERSLTQQTWYEEEVRQVENANADQLDQCEKELEVSQAMYNKKKYRSECFTRAERKEEELEKELKGIGDS